MIDLRLGHHPLLLKGCGQVLMPWAYPNAHELAEAGWLERRSEDDGPSSWWWTPEAEAALDMNALRRDEPADLN